MAENCSCSACRGGGASGGDELIKLILGGMVALGILYLLFLIIVYGAVLGMIAGAIYLGAKLGAAGSGGMPPWGVPDYMKVHQLEGRQRQILANLPEGNEELREVVETSFQQKKLDLYRPKTDDRPIINFDIEAAKEKFGRILRGKK